MSEFSNSGNQNLEQNTSGDFKNDQYPGKLGDLSDINKETSIEIAAESDPPGFLELVYGVLFEPGKMMKKVALHPPLGLVALIVAVISAVSAFMGFLIFLRVLVPNLDSIRQLLPAAVVFILIGGILWGYLKLFIYSGILHLAAALLGGGGEARGVFAAVGLSWIPNVFLVPIQFLYYWAGSGKAAVLALALFAGLAVGVWSIVILVIGIKNVHGLSTGKSVFTVFSPFIAIMVMFFLMVIMAVVIAVSVPSDVKLPGYF